METNVPSTRPAFLNGWRIAGWGSLLAILLLPALAMQFTAEVNWTASDFVFASILLGFLGAVVELAVRLARPGGQRIGYVIAGATTFLTLWSNAAVGIIGDDDFINSFFFIMIIVAIIIGGITRFQPGRMKWIAATLGLGQYGVGVAALSLMPGHAVEWGVLTFFALLWFASSWCFSRSTKSHLDGSKV